MQTADYERYPEHCAGYPSSSKKIYFLHLNEAKKKNMCVYGHPTHPIFQPPTLTFLISNYSTLIFASDPINFYTEFG